jgi:hypothetical protein
MTLKNAFYFLKWARLTQAVRRLDCDVMIIQWLVYKHATNCISSKIKCLFLVALYKERTLANVNICRCLAFAWRSGTFIVPHLPGLQFFRSHSKDHPIQSLCMTCKRMLLICSNPNSHGFPFSRFGVHSRGYWESNFIKTKVV